VEVHSKHPQRWTLHARNHTHLGQCVCLSSLWWRPAEFGVCLLTHEGDYHREMHDALVSFKCADMLYWWTDLLWVGLSNLSPNCLGRASFTLYSQHITFVFNGPTFCFACNNCDIRFSAEPKPFGKRYNASSSLNPNSSTAACVSPWSHPEINISISNDYFSGKNDRWEFPLDSCSLWPLGGAQYQAHPPRLCPSADKTPCMLSLSFAFKRCPATWPRFVSFD
jgi:hypothetical protein